MDSNTPPDSRTALRNLLIVLAVFIGVLIYSYGWTVTEIDLERPQEAQRQENVTIALRELLSPRIFQQERSVQLLSAPFLMECDTGDSPEQVDPTSSDDTTLIIEPTCAESGDTVTVTVVNGEPNADARIRWMPPAEDGEEPRPRPREILETERENIVIAGNGSFTGTIEVPRIRGGEGQIHEVQVQIAVPAGRIELSETAILVADRMLQTIFMALVATTIAIPIAGVLSFFAARNLMQDITLTTGSMLLAFITFVIGIIVGARFIAPLGNLGVMIGRGDLGGGAGPALAFALPLAVTVGVGYLFRMLNPPTDTTRNVTVSRTRQTLNTLVLSVSVIFLLSALGGLGLLGGEQISILGENITGTDANWFRILIGTLVSATGNFLTILGTLVELAVTPFTAAIVGFAFAGIAGNVIGPSLRAVPDSLGRVLGFVLGAIAGATLLTFTAQLGLWATLLGILTPLIAALLAGNLLLTITRLLLANTGQERLLRRLNNNRMPRLVIFGIGAVVTFVYVFGILNIGRSLVDGTLPSQNPAVVFGTTLPITGYVLRAALVGSVLAALGGLISGVKSAFPLGNTLYNTSRTLLNIVRSIEPLIMGLVFVVCVGIVPFAGVLALTLHIIAALGKLYS